MARAVVAFPEHALGINEGKTICVVVTDGQTTEFLFPTKTAVRHADPDNQFSLAHVFQGRIDSLVKPGSTPEDVVRALLYNTPFNADVVEYDTYEEARSEAERYRALLDLRDEADPDD